MDSFKDFLRFHKVLCECTESSRLGTEQTTAVKRVSEQNVEQLSKFEKNYEVAAKRLNSNLPDCSVTMIRYHFIIHIYIYNIYGFVCFIFLTRVHY